MKTAILGLPMVGKTSLFTILTGVHESTRIGSMEARVGVAKVPDARVEALAELYKPPKVTHATVEYLDFPAVSKEALRDPSYLASLRTVDALAHVLRIFESDTVPHEKGSVDPLRDLEDIETELILRILSSSKSGWSASTKIARRSRAPISITNLTYCCAVKPPSKTIVRSALSISLQTKRNGSAAFNFYRKSRCCLC